MNFFVGQRVRLVRTYFKPALLGAECRIVSIGKAWKDASEEPIGCDIELDLRDGELPVAAHADQLEPILPSGHQPSELTVEELLPFLRNGVPA